MSPPPAPDPSGALTACLDRAFAGAAPRALGVALSGGGDSTALALLAADWTQRRGVPLLGITVDHGLRPDSGAEAAAAAALCARLGFAHRTLRWQDRGAAGNLQDRARRARLDLIGGCARAEGLEAVLLGHTRDDQAETVLLRLLRGSGVDGLSGMAAARRHAGILWLRPLLPVGRTALRALLRQRGLDWAEDPSNDDPRFDRVRARQALAALSGLGVTPEGLAVTAQRMAVARQALAQAAAAAAGRLARRVAGDLLIDHAGLQALPQETRERLMAQALRWVALADYPPRRRALQALLKDLAAGVPRATLHGCVVGRGRDGRLRIAREWRAVQGLHCPPHAPWDGRWRLRPKGPQPVPRPLPQSIPEGATLAALGPEGLAACPGWRDSGLPRGSLLATPALWQEGRLLAAPLAGPGAPGCAAWCAELSHPWGEFPASFILH